MRKIFFILSFCIFSLRMKVFVASFSKLFLLSHFDFCFFLLLLFVEGKIFLLVSSGFLFSSLHFSFVRLFFSFFTLFSLCFSLFLLFFFLNTCLSCSIFPPGSNCFVSSLSFLFLCLYSHLQFRVFQHFRTKNPSYCNVHLVFSIPFVDFLFLQEIKVNFRKCIVVNCVSHLFCIQVLYLLFF